MSHYLLLVAKRLSTFLKRKYEPTIFDRDGKDCFYCEKPFPTKKLGIISFSTDKRMKRVFDHLNNDRSYNDVVNLVFAHSICNQQKKNNPAWISKAKTKLRDNEMSAEVPISHAGTDKETTTETDSNAVFCEIALKTLSYYLQPNGDIPAKTEQVIFKEFLDLVCAKCYKLVGHASQITMRRIVDMFCTKEFPYLKEKNEQKKYIIRLRKEEEY